MRSAIPGAMGYFLGLVTGLGAGAFWDQLLIGRVPFTGALSAWARDATSEVVLGFLLAALLLLLQARRSRTIAIWKAGILGLVFSLLLIPAAWLMTTMGTGPLYVIGPATLVYFLVVTFGVVLLPWGALLR